MKNPDKYKAAAEKAKVAAGKAKDKADVLVDKNRQKLPDSVERAYGKVSKAAEKYLPHTSAPPPEGDAATEPTSAPAAEARPVGDVSEPDRTPPAG